jgi:hypothetical protein
MIKHIIRPLIYTALIGFFVFAWWASKQAQHYQTELGPQLRQQYGFATGTPIINAGGKRIEVLTVYPEKGGLIEKSGFKKGDIILSTSLTGFYQALHEQQFPLTFVVVDGGDGKPINDRTKRTIIFND